VGESRRKAEVEAATGVVQPLPPKVRRVQWTFELPPEGYETFKKAHAYMREKDARVPESEESFAAGLLTIGLKSLVAKIAKEEEKNKTIWTPQDAQDASRRLQAIKGGK